MAVRRIQRCLVGSLAPVVIGFLGCSDPEPSNTQDVANGGPPHLLALSTYSASLGSPIDAYMANPPPATAQKIELVFDGDFTRSDGQVVPVKMTQDARRTEAGAIRWTQFGPFANPFTPDNPAIGVFKGKVGVQATLEDGSTTTDANPLPLTFEVKPSIILTELQPTTATCAKPALRLIGAMSYKMKAITLGFKATSIEYTFRVPGFRPDANGKPVLDMNGDGEPVYRTTKIAHATTGSDTTTTTDAIDGKEVLVLPPVPPDVPNYGVVFAVTAKDDEGHRVATTFAMTAHNPLDIFDDGRFQLAQIYPATPVSSCIPGGQQGRNVDYGESKTESRQRQLSLTLSKSWLKSEENNWSTSDGKTFTKSKTVSDGFSRTHGTSNTFSFEQNHSSTSGASFNWSDSFGGTVGGTVGGEIGFLTKGRAEGRFEGRYDHMSGGSRSSSTTSGWSKGQSNTTMDSQTVDHSTATTDSDSVSHTENKGGSESNQNGGGEAANDSWTVSSSDTIQRGFSGSVIAGTYGVFYRQLARYTRRAFVLEYNKCGEAEVIGDVTLQDYVWAPDLALGQACPPLPNSNFPEAQCYLPPCDP